jgi:hypothetical protein
MPIAFPTNGLTDGQVYTSSNIPDVKFTYNAAKQVWVGATTGSGSGYVLPAATTSVLGGVKLGAGLTTDASGKLIMSLGAGLATDSSGNIILASLDTTSVTSADAPYIVGVYNIFARKDNSLWQPGTTTPGSTIAPVGSYIPSGAPEYAAPGTFSTTGLSGNAVPPWTGNYIRFDSKTVPGTWRCVTTLGAGGVYVTSTTLGNTPLYYQVVNAIRIA